jgi:beta-N-acetylhexosaminidase
VSWAVYPALDANLPAGLSPAVVQGELRNRLGYQGVTVTDAIEAGALQAFGTDANRSVLAAKAGMDLILCANGNVAQGDSVNAALVNALQSGQLSQSSFAAAVNRVTALRDGLH